jgi:hypothetical protein
MRVGVAPGTTAFVVQPPDLSGLACGPLVNGRLDLSALGTCPPDPVVQFLTNPFIPDSTTPAAYRRAGGGIPVGPGPLVVGMNPYGTESTLMGGSSPLGVSWGVLVGVFAAALASGGVVGWFTRKRRR